MAVETLKSSGRSRFRTAAIWIGAILGLTILLGAVGFVVWAEMVPTPMPEAITALQSTTHVAVTDQQWTEFAPIGQKSATGFIFYPGGKVDAHSYAPMLQQLAETGYYAAIPPMRLNLAFFSPNRAGDVIAAHPEIQNWVIGGHSLGGVMAADYAFEHPDAIQGLVLLASYPQASKSLAERDDLKVISIFGTNDGLAKKTDIEESKSHLPHDTRYVAIEGGNHAQFGWYGEQNGDNAATISREDQQAQVIAAILELLQNVESDAQ